MHRILERQIKRAFGERVVFPPGWKAFLGSISGTYARLEKGRDVLDRSLKLNERVAGLEDLRRAMSNILEDFQAEREALIKANAKDEALLKSIGDGVIATDNYGRVIVINKIAEELLGFSDKEIIGKKFIEMIFLEDADGKGVPYEQRPVIMALSSSGSSVNLTPAPDHYLVGKNKRKFPVSIIASPVILDGEVVGTIEVFRDITREKQIDKIKTEFVSIASHQLRTPLATVSWYAEMLLSGDAGALSSKQNEYLAEIYKSNRRMVTLVNALIEASRLELGTVLIDSKPTDVVKCAKEAIGEVISKIKSQRLKFVEQYGEGLPPLAADPKLLKTIFDNLLSNAVKFTPEGGSVSIDLRLARRGEPVGERKMKDDSIAIIVKDSGCGIPKGQQDNVFTKLFRADNVRKKNIEGTGLGLFIVKHAIGYFGGMIWFESEENKGTMFYVTLPLTGIEKHEINPLT